MRNSLFAFLVLSLVANQPLGAADQAAQERFFETKIRPVLVDKCYECHSESSAEVKGGLLLDTREGIRRGGDNGHAVVPGELQDSLILDAMRWESFEMPPDEQLPDNVIADFERWIRMGAPDPRDGSSAPVRGEIDVDQARQFWSFQPIGNPPPPSTQNSPWPKSSIDAFVLSRLQEANLRPVPDADSQTLVRRIYFDLLGLPPTPEQVDEFVRAVDRNRDEAISDLVDRLLDLPQFGQRWGRHWLDVVRYAESTGMERNATFTRAWLYRDYVIDAFNRDTPFDQFAHQQIAGDLLPYQSSADRQRQLIATGLLALGPKSLNEPSQEKFQMDVVDEQIDVVTRAFLGLTASCARCHDHKFDPIPQTEYYALAGIFTSTETFYGTPKTNGNRNPGRLLAIDGDSVVPTAVSGGEAGSGEEKKFRQQLKDLQNKLAKLEKQLKVAKNDAAKASIQQRIDELEDQTRTARNRLKRATQPSSTPGEQAMLVMAVAEADAIGDTQLRVRGEPDDHGKVIPRGFLTIASTEPTGPLDRQGSGRRELAQWITAPTNPLTPRVIVNRVWQHLFGRGIVQTVNNFGANGDRPSHPQLLDHLAATFVEDGWSIKRLVRRIMLSRVYQMSSQEDAAALAVDPDNHLLWRMNQRRLEAEAIRDAMLAASGQLDLTEPLGSPVEKLGEGIIGRELRADQAAEASAVRSVYLPIVRGELPEILRLFDFPEPSIIGDQRDVTTVPTQALFLMNNPQVLACATKLAERVITSSSDPRERVTQAYRLTVCRQPSGEELDRALAYVDQTQAALADKATTGDLPAESIAWTGFCQSLLAASEFRYLN